MKRLDYATEIKEELPALQALYRRQSRSLMRRRRGFWFCAKAVRALLKVKPA